MMNAVQPKTPDAVLQALQQHGAAVGAKKMMQWEFRHAREALRTGVYITLWNDRRKHECTRLGKLSRCFCNHLYGKHKVKKLKNGRFGKAACSEAGCKCVDYLYMFRRPEEIGQAFLTRRKGFDVTQWRPLCSCKHPHAVHDPVKDRMRCRECNCSRFVGNFCCLGCDGKWEEHEVLHEDRQAREEEGKAVGEAFYPLADVPEIQQEFLRQLQEEEDAEKEKKETEGAEKEKAGVGELEKEKAVVGELNKKKAVVGELHKEKAVVGELDNEKAVIGELEKGLSEVALAGQSGGTQVSSLASRASATLPAREKPERSVRLMKEQGMLRKY